MMTVDDHQLFCTILGWLQHLKSQCRMPVSLEFREWSSQASVPLLQATFGPDLSHYRSCLRKIIDCMHFRYLKLWNGIISQNMISQPCNTECQASLGIWACTSQFTAPVWRLVHHQHINCLLTRDKGPQLHHGIVNMKGIHACYILERAAVSKNAPDPSGKRVYFGVWADAFLQLKSTLPRS